MLGGEESPSVLLCLKPWRARSVARVLEEWSALPRVFHRAPRFVEGVALVSAASLRARHGEPREALELFSRVIDQWQRTGNWTQQWTTLRNVIDLFVRLSADEPSVVLMAALRASRLAAPLFGSDAARLAEAEIALQTRVPTPDYHRYQARGNAMTDEDAVSFALAELHRLRTRAPDSSLR